MELVHRRGGRARREDRLGNLSSGVESLPAKPRERLFEVLGRLTLPMNPLARLRVLEAEPRGVQHEARRWEERPFMSPYVYALAYDGVTRFAQMNANLMRAPGLEDARDEGGSRRAGQSLERLDVRDGVLSLTSDVPAAV